MIIETRSVEIKLLMQKQSFQIELNETENALSEIVISKDDS